MSTAENHRFRWNKRMAERHIKRFMQADDMLIGRNDDSPTVDLLKDACVIVDYLCDKFGFNPNEMEPSSLDWGPSQLLHSIIKADKLRYLKKGGQFQ